METTLRDHMANERTFLAWLRTAMAVIAFGFVLDRFSLYIQYLAPTALQASSHSDVRLVGAGLMWMGTLLIPVALYHFIAVQRDIDRSIAAKPHTWLVVVLGSLVAIIAIYLSLTLARMG